MNYEDIKNYAARCDSHPDHQTGIITHQIIMDRLHDEIEELRGFIEAKCKPLTNEEIDALLAQSAGVDLKLNGGDLLFARAIERAHGIGGEK